MSHPTGRERGAAAVEFALVLPVLLLLIMGIIDFSHAFVMNGNIASAARAGAREMALSKDPEAARRSAVAASAVGGLTVADVAVLGTSCTPANGDAVVTINHTYRTLTGFFGATRVASGKGVMRCGG